MKFFKVGGCVRDELMGLKPRDVDYVVVGGSKNKLTNIGYHLVGKAFPVFLHPQTREEYALAVSDVNGVLNFASYITIEEDLERRDLTINSMAIDDTGALIDPFNGLSDLNNKIIRHTSKAFASDPMRIIRAARFYGSFDGFEIHPSTIEFCRKMIKDGSLDKTVKDRVYLEVKKGLLIDKPSRFIDGLDKVGALKKLFPVIYDMKGVPQSEIHHNEGCVYTHTMMVLDEAAKLSKDLDDKDRVAVLMGALFHDVGKTKTPEHLLYDVDGKAIGKHHDHENIKVVKPIIDDIKNLMELPNSVYYNILYSAVNHLKVHRIFELRGSSFVDMADSMSLKKQSENGAKTQFLENFLLTCKADALGRLMLVDGVQVKPSDDYPQYDRVINYFNEYIRSDKDLGEWISNFEVKNDRKPNVDEIKKQKRDIVVRNVTRVKKQLDRELKSIKNPDVHCNTADVKKRFKIKTM